jgi:hypothetical protein
LRVVRSDLSLIPNAFAFLNASFESMGPLLIGG